MICPTCQSQLLLSQVRLVSSYGKDPRIDEFWDETGIFHRHDMTINIDSYECTKGHAFDVVRKGTDCPAGDPY